jgi:hypothetical protein
MSPNPKHMAARIRKLGVITELARALGVPVTELLE